jgi:hypothetical protein
MSSDEEGVSEFYHCEVCHLKYWNEASVAICLSGHKREALETDVKRRKVSTTSVKREEVSTTSVEREEVLKFKETPLVPTTGPRNCTCMDCGISFIMMQGREPVHTCEDVIDVLPCSDCKLVFVRDGDWLLHRFIVHRVTKNFDSKQ